MMYLVPNYKSMNMVYKNNQQNQLWLGDMGAATDYKLLAAKNIKYVYTAAALDVSYKKQQGIIQKKIQAYDMPSYDMSQHFGSAYNFLHDSLQKGNVLVHCAAGISRSATIVIMYLMKLNNWELIDTINYVRSKRSVVYPNPGFVYQLKLFENSLKKKIQFESEQKAVINFLNQEQDNMSKTQQQNFRQTQNSVFNKTVVQDRNKSLVQPKKFTRETMNNFSMRKEPLKTKNTFKGQYTSFREPKITTHKRNFI